jgi:3-methyladenine DNA glycosylase/8-oxoguanine DNA glycosylase
MKESLTVLRRDKRLARLIKKHGAPTLSRYFPSASGIFRALLRSIIYQQLSGKAAASIHARFVALFPRKRPTPALVLKMPEEKLRACGLSYQKIRYMKDLAQKFENRTIKHRALAKMSSEEIIAHLTQVKGIGEWTVHMLLIFTMGRLDVLPVGDLGIKKGFQIVYDLKALPDKKTMERLAAHWRAHSSVASWYLWRAADEAKIRS